MKSKLFFVGLLLAMSGCQVHQSAPTSVDLQSWERGSAAYLQKLTPDERKNYEDAKGEWLKTATGDPAAFKKDNAEAVLFAQRTLGSLGYGVLFTGEFDRSTKQAVSHYQKNNGIFQSGYLDPLTDFAISRDEALLNKGLVSLGLFNFYARSWNHYFAVDGSWDYQNKDDNMAQTSHIECETTTRLCNESYAGLGFGTALVVGIKGYNVTRWDDYRIVAELLTTPCEKDELEIVRDTQTVTLHMTLIDRDKANCKGYAGEATTEDAHLIDGRKTTTMEKQNEMSKKREALYEYSESAKKIIEELKK